jgi:hypothetical protein
MRKPDQVAGLIEHARRELGQVDILVNNAASSIPRRCRISRSRSGMRSSLSIFPPCSTPPRRGCHRGGLRCGQAWSRRSYQSSGAGNRHHRRHVQRNLSRLGPDPTGAEADRCPGRRTRASRSSRRSSNSSPRSSRAMSSSRPNSWVTLSFSCARQRPIRSVAKPWPWTAAGRPNKAGPRYEHGSSVHAARYWCSEFRDARSAGQRRDTLPCPRCARQVPQLCHPAQGVPGTGGRFPPSLTGFQSFRELQLQPATHTRRPAPRGPRRNFPRTAGFQLNRVRRSAHGVTAGIPELRHQLPNHGKNIKRPR